MQGFREPGGPPAAPLRPQRQPEQAGAEKEGEGERKAHALAGSALGAEPLLELSLDLARLGEAPQLFLGKDEVVPDGDLENASVTPDELRLDAELLRDLGRQTGGAGVVVSACAVLDGYLVWHAAPPIRGHYTDRGPRRPEARPALQQLSRALSWDDISSRLE
jgi:hypothetical protein